MGKYKLTTEPALPAKCVGCNNDVKATRPLVDTSASLDYYGAILLCADCVTEMAELIGLVPESELKKELQLGNELAVRLSEANTKVKALEDVVRAYGLGQFVITDVYASDSDAQSSDEKVGHSDKRDDRKADPDKGSGDSASTEPEPGLFK